MTNKTNQFPTKFSMTATTKSDFMAAEDYLKTIGATKQSDDGFNAYWIHWGILYTIARAF